MRLRRSAFHRLLAIPAATVLIGSLALEAGAQGGPDLQLFNHFKVYNLLEPASVPPPRIVDLVGEFGTERDVVLTMVEKIATPADKNLEGIWDGLEHQLWYRLGEPPLPHPVEVGFENQFGPQFWTVTQPRYLVVPAEKDGLGAPGSCTAGTVGAPCVKHSDCDITPGDGSGVCRGLDHFKCYEATGLPIGVPLMWLEDQFGTHFPEPFVESPALWCDPVNKTVVASPYPEEIGSVYPIGTAVHLACYHLSPPMIVDQPHVFRDQIFTDEVAVWVVDSELLCVPSHKTQKGVPTMGRWGLASVAVLLIVTTATWAGYRRRRIAPGRAA